MKAKNIVCSFSGGRSSAYMVYLLETLPEYKEYTKYYVFANTSKELVETILFVKNVQWLFDIKVHLIESVINQEKGVGSSYKEVTFGELCMDGTLFTEMSKAYGIPSLGFPNCTRELKIVPIRKFVKEYLGLTKEDTVQAIGYRFDEPKRVSNRPGFIYPLYDRKVTKQIVEDFWIKGDMYKYDLGLESWEGNCDFCFKKSRKNLHKMYIKYPERFAYWAMLVYDESQMQKLYRGEVNPFDLINEWNNNEVDIDCACNNSEDIFSIL